MSTDTTPALPDIVARLREAALGEQMFGFDGMRDQADPLLTEAADEIERLRAALSAAAVPAGWKLVPVEPTEAMLAAAHESDREYTLRNFGDVMTVSQGPWDHYVAMLAAAPAPSAPQPQEEFPANEKLLALADRIDYEQLWRRPALERFNWPQDKRDRLDAGVELRRYAEFFKQDCWRIFPPKPGLSFRASTLDKVVEMARQHEDAAQPQESQP